MAKGTLDLSILSNIGKAIRYVNGLNTKYAPGDMPSAIRSLKNTFGTKTVLKNGTYTAAADNLDGFDRVTVNVQGDDTVLVEKNITANGEYSPSDDNADGYSSVNVAVPNTYSAADNGKVVSGGQLVEQTGRSVEANGTYDTTENNSVVVAVQNSYSASDEGKVVQNGALASQSTRAYSANGWYDTTTVSRIHIDVPATTPNLQVKTVTANGTFEADPGYDGLLRVIVNVSGGGGVANAIETESGDALETENGDIIEFDGGTES